MIDKGDLELAVNIVYPVVAAPSFVEALLAIRRDLTPSISPSIASRKQWDVSGTLRNVVIFICGSAIG